MENESRLQAVLTRAQDWLSEQVWFQEIQQKWSSLDPRVQLWVRLGALVGTVLGVLGIFAGFWLQVSSARSELDQKTELLGLLQSGADEVRRLKSTASSGLPEGTTWKTVLESQAGELGMDTTAVQVGDEKPGSTSDHVKETLLDVTLKHVNIKQVVRYAFGLENSGKPMKVRSLLIETEPDASGYMTAKLGVSGFQLK